MLLTGIYLVNAQCSRHMPVLTNPSYSEMVPSCRTGYSTKGL